MKRILTAAILLLAIPGVAQAKEIDGVAVCGPAGCESVAVKGFGHQPPFDSAAAGEASPPAGPFYRIKFSLHGKFEETWVIYYEPKSGLGTWISRPEGWITWTRFAPKLAAAIKQLAQKVEPFPRPAVSEVTMGAKSVKDGADSYLRMFEFDQKYAEPSGTSDVLRIVSPIPSPWTDGIAGYYPEDDVVKLGAGRFVSLPPDLAADVEAGRPLGAGDSAFPWVVLVAAVAGGLALVGAVVLLVRRANRTVAGAVAEARVASGAGR